MATHSSVLAWRIPWQRDLVGYSLWGCKELDMTKQLTHTHISHRSTGCSPRKEHTYHQNFPVFPSFVCQVRNNNNKKTCDLCLYLPLSADTVSVTQMALCVPTSAEATLCCHPSFGPCVIECLHILTPTPFHGPKISQTLNYNFWKLLSSLKSPAYPSRCIHGLSAYLCLHPIFHPIPMLSLSGIIYLFSIWW